MRKRMNLYKVVDQNGKQVFENLLTAKQVTEKTGCTKNNVAQAAANFALVNKKYRIIPEDIKLSKVLDVELPAEWDRYRKERGYGIKSGKTISAHSSGIRPDQQAER